MNITDFQVPDRGGRAYEVWILSYKFEVTVSNIKHSILLACTTTTRNAVLAATKRWRRRTRRTSRWGSRRRTGKLTIRLEEQCLEILFVANLRVELNLNEITLKILVDINKREITNNRETINSSKETINNNNSSKEIINIKAKGTTNNKEITSSKAIISNREIITSNSSPVVMVTIVDRDEFKAAGHKQVQ